MIEIKPLWKNHPLYLAGKVELLPTAWVYSYCGTDVSAVADLMDGTKVDLENLWNNLLLEGMHDPFIMRVGIKNMKMRLESGNHRIQAFYAHGVDFVPVTVQVRLECGPHAPDVMTDATKNFDATNKLKIDSITDEYMKPSDVFKNFD